MTLIMIDEGQPVRSRSAAFAGASRIAGGISARHVGLRAVIGLAIALAGNVPAFAAPAPHTYGPEPSWARFRAMAEAAITARLIDPESARILWSRGFRKGGFKPVLEPSVSGYVACGLVNARNRMGGYTGVTEFVVVIDYDRILYAGISRGLSDPITTACAGGRAKGLFPELPSETASMAADTGNGAGLAVRSMPEGAYVVAVRPDSPAARAGLAPGMVITNLSGIQLAGLGDAMTRIVEQASGELPVTLVGGARLTLYLPVTGQKE